MRRQELGRTTLVLSLGALIFAFCSSADAQQPKFSRIGYLSAVGDPENRGPIYSAFRSGLEELGYNEGKNLFVEYRTASGHLDRAPALAAELVKLKVDVIVVGYLAGIRAAKQATASIPIVMVSQEDPTKIGLIDNLAHPGGNITGVATFGRDLSGKRLELIKEAFSSKLKVGVLFDASAPGPPIAFREYEAVARELKIPLLSAEVRGPKPDFENAFRVAVLSRVNALIVIRNPVVARNLKLIVDLAIKNRLPSMAEGNEYVEAGFLMSYAANMSDQYKRAAYFVNKILQGSKPAELPVEQPKKLEFIINLKTAKQIGLTIPPNVLARADRVIK